MNALEKILEEMLNYERVVKTDEDLEWNRAMYRCSEIIRSYMDEMNNDDWIPVEERLPEEHDSIFATSKWDGAMWEKLSDEVNVTYELEDGTRKVTTSYTLDGVWKLEKESKVVKKKVVAWQPLPEQYKPNKNSRCVNETKILFEEKKKGEYKNV